MRNSQQMDLKRKAGLCLGCKAAGRARHFICSWQEGRGFQLPARPRKQARQQKGSLVGAKERRTGWGGLWDLGRQKEQGELGRGMDVACGNPRTAYFPTHPLIHPTPHTHPFSLTALITELWVTAYTLRSYIWPLILKKPIKTDKLTVKSRRRGFIQYGRIGKRIKETH